MTLKWVSFSSISEVFVAWICCIFIQIAISFHKTYHVNLSGVDSVLNYVVRPGDGRKKPCRKNIPQAISVAFAVKKHSTKSMSCIIP